MAIGASIVSVIRILICFLVFSATTARADDVQPTAPAWTDDLSRTVIGGDILHGGMGIGATPEQARFRAEAQAVRNVISECTLPHTDIRIWNRYVEQRPDGGFSAYARAGISFSSCNEAKTAKSPLREQLVNPKLQADQEEFSRLEHPPVERPSDDGALAKLRTWVKDSYDRVMAAIQKTDAKMDGLNKRVDALASKPQTVQVIQTQVRIPAGAERYEECSEDYRALTQEAQMAANSYGHPPGNLTSPRVAPLYNRAMRKAALCRTIKSVQR